MLNVTQSTPLGTVHVYTEAHKISMSFVARLSVVNVLTILKLYTTLSLLDQVPILVYWGIMSKFSLRV